MNWSKYPFIRLVIPFALGILICESSGAATVALRNVWASAMLMLGIAVLNHIYNKVFATRWVFGLFAFFSLFLLGYGRCLSKNQQGDRCVGAGESVYLARVYDPPVAKEKSVKVVLDLMACHQGSKVRERDGSTPVNGKVMAYFPLEDSIALHYGDLVLFSQEIEEVEGPKNPEEFDYRTYLRRQGITGRVYLKQESWTKVAGWKGNRLYAWSYQARDFLLRVLQRCGLTDEEYGVAAAILLGYDESLPAEVRQGYVAAGSMHILCVSGMHVGIIYMIAGFLLGLLGGGRVMSLLRKLLLLLLMWSYAFIAGLSPSILRSTLMISFVIVGELIQRQGFTMNSIAASAFILLLMDPYNLYAMGFQLSYSAVIGIVILQRPIYRLLYVKNKFLDKVWEITAVSLAAQVATMPFTVYYFKQFTTYFWLSNLFMTPLSFVVILGGMLLLLLSWVPYLGLLLGKFEWLSIHVMNFMVSWVERLPNSIVRGLYMTRLEFSFSLVLLLLLLIYVALRPKRVVLESLVVALLFSASLAWRSYQTERQRLVMVYSVRNHTAIDIIEGRSHVMFCDSLLKDDGSSVDYSLRGFWASRQLREHDEVFTLQDAVEGPFVTKHGDVIAYDGGLLAIWNPSLLERQSYRSLEVDYLLVTGRQRADLSHILDYYDFKVLLIDASVPSYLDARWREQAALSQRECRSIRDGCFAVDLSNLIYF